MRVWLNDWYRVPVKSWCEDIEAAAMEQIDHLAQLPFVYRHVAIMPDCHMGYGMPIGGVIATQDVVIPNAVGVDIGCGVAAVKLDIKVNELPVGDIQDIVAGIKKVIPVGFKHLESPEPQEQMPRLPSWKSNTLYDPEIGSSLRGKGLLVVQQQFENARYQLGTLGGGNHFIEIQKDSEDTIWVMVHSGSRNLGKQVADFYNKLAVEINEKWYSSVPKEWQLAFLPLNTVFAQDYLFEMNYCVEFAYENRSKILHKVVNVFREVYKPDIRVVFQHDVAHNYAVMENHFGQNVLVHRKGATRAREFDVGFIPGSQGTASYYVEGEGNKDSFYSCSHGAGRVMGRKAAQKNLDLETEQAKLNGKGIIHSIKTVADLDEAAGAYKDIDNVMAQQTDLVSILEKLEPLAVVKG